MTTSYRSVLAPDALAGKVALVTGAARGIGQATAVELARAGAVIALNDIDHEAEETVRLIEDLGRPVSFHQGDVSSRASVEATVDAVVRTHGRLDCLIANAGISVPEHFLEITDEVMQRTLDINLRGVILCGQAAARQMVRQGEGGQIVNISSVHAVASFRGFAVYDAAKAGVMRLTATMAADLAEHQITVNAIGPGWMLTPMNAAAYDTPEKRAAVDASLPLHRVGLPEEIGGVAAFLCSPAASYVTGSFILVDGGLSLAH
jgi:glucose 1-dehydrogenase